MTRRGPLPYGTVLDSRVQRHMHVRSYPCENGIGGRIGVTLGWWVDSPAVILTELPDNFGGSVTNNCETYARAAWAEFREALGVSDPWQVRWFDHSASNLDPSVEMCNEHIDEILFRFNPVHFNNPRWRRVSLTAIGVGEAALRMGRNEGTLRAEEDEG